MIVGVRTYADSKFYEYFDVPVSSRDVARKVAYQYLFRNPYVDFNTLVQNTIVIEAKPISQDLIDYLR